MYNGTRNSLKPIGIDRLDGFRIISGKRRLDPSRTPARVVWAVRVCKMYLHGLKYGYTPKYPAF